MHTKFPIFSFRNSENVKQLENFLDSMGLSPLEVKGTLFHYRDLKEYYKGCNVPGHFFNKAEPYIKDDEMNIGASCYGVTRFSSILFSSIKPLDKGSVKLYNLRKSIINKTFDKRFDSKIVEGIRYFMDQINSSDLGVSDGYLGLVFYCGVHISILTSMMVMKFKNFMKVNHGVQMNPTQCIILSVAIMRSLMQIDTCINLIMSLRKISKKMYRSLAINFFSDDVDVIEVIENVLSGGVPYEYQE